MTDGSAGSDGSASSDGSAGSDGLAGLAGSPVVSAAPAGAAHSVAGRTVLVAGATSAAGLAVASALSDAGARVIGVGSNTERLQALRERVPGVITRVCDLSNFTAVTKLAETVRAEVAHHGHGSIDGLIHLVGGWRGGGGLDGQTDDDWDFLHSHIVTTLRNTTRAFNSDLLASPAGRLAIVSSVSVDKPTPGGANYASAKAAAETWTRAVGQGFAKAPVPVSGQSAAAVIFIVRALDGLEAELAARVVGLWDAPAASVNNTRITLTF